MEIMTGIFESLPSATQAVTRLRELGLPPSKIKLLTPDLSQAEILGAIPVDDTERAGMGLALGAVLGGAGGFLVSLFFAPKPGFFPVEAGRAFFTLAALVGGALVGRRLERVATEGIPHDDLHVAAAALAQGECVVVAVTASREQARAIREALDAAGAESLSAAHEAWWRGIREREKAEFESRRGPRFETAEPAFRAGFVTALHRRFRGRPFEGAAEELRALHGAVAGSPDFRLGYERGQTYLHSSSWWVARPVPAGSGARADQRRWW